MFWFLVGTYVGYRISNRYDIEKIIKGAKKEMADDVELQHFLQKMKKIKKELRRKEEEEEE
jgi:hypothetical protein